ncbi:MAG: hypothetical protein DYG96_00715 [Chlorobi bacterium CHB2]|nr:hypothetical protein [Chlorobi bacterium CHB2]
MNTLLRSAALLSLFAVIMASTAAAKGPATKVFVVNQADSTVSLVDLTTMKEIRVIHVGASPYFASVSGDQTTLAVAVEGDQKVKFYDTKNFQLKGELTVGKMYAEHMMEFPDGKRFMLANRYGNAILIIGYESMQIEERIPDVSSPHNIRLGGTERYVYATSKTNPGISVIDLQTRKVVRFVSTKYIPRGLAGSVDDRYFYCGANWISGMFMYETETGKFVRFIQTPLPHKETNVLENTYHGFEAVNDSIVLGTFEGLSALDVMNTHTGAVVFRTENVAMPSAVLAWPGKPGWYVFTNMKSSTVQTFQLTKDYKIDLGPAVKCGTGRIELPKRFCFFWG